MRLTTLDLKSQLLGRKTDYYFSSGTRFDSPVMEGTVLTEKCGSGLLVHATHATELADGEVRTRLPVGLRFGLVLHGELKFSIAGRNVYAASADQGLAGEDGFCIGLTESAEWRRELIRGNEVSKVLVAVDEGWVFERLGPGLRDLFYRVGRSPAVCFGWLASHEIRESASALLSATRYSGALRSLHLESKALDFVVLCLMKVASKFQAGDSEEAAENTRSARSARRIRCRLDSLLESTATFHFFRDVSKPLGMSTSKVQRTFKQYYGETVSGYVRRHRLEEARRSLENQCSSVSEAAFLAGYTHPSNFSAAFKRAFGVSPSAYRRHATESC